MTVAHNARRLRASVLAAVGFALAACQTAEAAQSAPLGTGAPAERGRRIAERDCSQCHNIGNSGPSPLATSPPFRDLTIRFNSLSFARRMNELAKAGHYEMPRRQLSEIDAEDIAAYLETLRR